MVFLVRLIITLKLMNGINSTLVRFVVIDLFKCTQYNLVSTIFVYIYLEMVKKEVNHDK